MHINSSVQCVRRQHIVAKQVDVMEARLTAEKAAVKSLMH